MLLVRASHWDIVERLLKLVCPSDIYSLLLFCIGTKKNYWGDLDSIKNDCMALGLMVKVMAPRWFS